MDYAQRDEFHEIATNFNKLLIAISGVYKRDPDKLLAGIVGFDHFLPKPYQASDVLKLLEPLRTPSEP